MRVVIAAVGADGRSRVQSCDDFEPSPERGRIWMSAPPFADDTQGNILATALEPPAGGSKAGIVTILPRSADTQANLPGFDAEGFHATRTVDYDYVIAGKLTLRLEDGEIDLSPGDVAVLDRVRHAWRSAGPEPAQFLSILVSALPADPAG
jgi:mannose-6-phosphate isomerase-like protein (cupin superfamily)